jgi:hypothetical protein
VQRRQRGLASRIHFASHSDRGPLLLTAIFSIWRKTLQIMGLLTSSDLAISAISLPSRIAWATLC